MIPKRIKQFDPFDGIFKRINSQYVVKFHPLIFVEVRKLDASMFQFCHMFSNLIPTIPEGERFYPILYMITLQFSELKSLSPRLELVKLLAQSVIQTCISLILRSILFSP